MKQVPNLRTLVLIDIGSHECHYEHKKAIIEIIFKLKYGGHACAHRFSVKRLVLVASNLAKI